MKSAVMALGVAVALSGCGKGGQADPPASSASQPQMAASAAQVAAAVPDVPPAVKNPQSQADMYQAAKFIGEHARAAPLTGELQSFAPADRRVRVADILADSAAVSQESLWPAIKDLPNSRFAPFSAITTPLGSFVRTAVKLDSGQDVDIVISVRERTATFIRAKGDSLTFTSFGLPTAAAMVFRVRQKAIELLQAQSADSDQVRGTVVSSLEAMAEHAPPPQQAQETDARADRWARHSEEARELRKRFGARIVYKTPEARRIVEEFELSCPLAKDGRYLPLSNVLLARLAQMDGKVVYATTVVDSRGSEVRISDVIRRRSDDKITSEALALQVNAWGELRSASINVEAVQNACYGGSGEIWVTP